jgi:adenylate kinase family enzyme
MKGVIVYGPQGCGKSANADLIKAHFGLTNVVDEWAGGEVLDNTLHLTNEPCADAMDYDDVIQQINTSNLLAS